MKYAVFRLVGHTEEDLYFDVYCPRCQNLGYFIANTINRLAFGKFSSFSAQNLRTRARIFFTPFVDWWEVARSTGRRANSRSHLNANLRHVFLFSTRFLERENWKIIFILDSRSSAGRRGQKHVNFRSCLPLFISSYEVKWLLCVGRWLS